MYFEISKYTFKGEIRMEINEEKRQKFIENAGKRVNNVLHDIQILEPMARSNNYDFTKADVEEMFAAMQETLNNTKEEYYKKFEMKAKSEKKAFVFGQRAVATSEKVVNIPIQNVEANITEDSINAVENVVANNDEIINEAETAVEENVNFSAE